MSASSRRERTGRQFTFRFTDVWRLRVHYFHVLQRLNSGVRKALRLLLDRLPKRMRFAVFRSMLSLDFEIPSTWEVKVAMELDELTQAFRILHDAYVRSGFMKPSPTGLRVTRFHPFPSTSTLVVKQEGRVIATVSLVRDNALGLPMESVFDISHFRRAGKRVAEVSSLAVDDSYRGSHGMALLVLLKFMWTYSQEYFGVDVLVNAVNPRRSDFYEGVLCHEAIVGARCDHYGFADGAPAVGFALDCAAAPRLFANAYNGKPNHKNLLRFMQPASRGGVDFPCIRFPERAYFKVSDPALSAAGFDSLFNEQTNLLRDMTVRERSALFDAYTGLPHQHMIPPPGDSSITPKRELRFDVYCEAQAALRSEVAHTVTLMDVSSCGVKLYSPRQMNTHEIYNVTAKINRETSTQLRIHLAWVRGDGYCGGEILERDQAWDDFIDYLYEDSSGA